MMNDGTIHDEHRQIADLIPWYVNGTLGAFEAQRVEAHVLACEACQEELTLERRLHERMAVEPSVEYMPAASLKRFQARLDGGAGESAAAEAKSAVVLTTARRFMPWRGLAAASMVLAAALAAFLTVERWSQLRHDAPSYHTVTSARSRAPDEVIRAVFSPTVTLVDLQAILDEAQLKIISGPTEAGVYSLAATSARPVGATLGLLRRHPEVRFAESTRADLKPEDADARSRESP